MLAIAALGLVAAAFAWLLQSPYGWAAPLPLLVVGWLLFRFERALPDWASLVVAFLADNVPLMSLFSKREEVKAANTDLATDFGLTLDEYRLPALTSEQIKKLVGDTRVLTIRRLLERVKKSPPGGLCTDALELLHAERSGLVTLNLWESRKKDLVGELAPVVLGSDRLRGVDRVYPFTEDDVREVLAHLRDFDVNFVAQELRILGELGRFLERYWHFIEQPLPMGEGLAAAFRDHVGLPADGSTLFRIESPASTMTLMDAFDWAAPALCAVHRGIFLAEREVGVAPLRDRACWDVARWDDDASDPTKVLHAYLWEKGRRGLGGRPITPRELDRHWEQWAAGAKGALAANPTAYADQLDDLRVELRAGNWPRRHVPDRRTPPPAPPPDDHDEVRDLDAYLITFDERSGPVAELVDSVKALTHGTETYRFGPYTRNTRLGLVPPHMPFHEFVELFFEDLDHVLRDYLPTLTNAPPGWRDVEEGTPRAIRLKHDHRCSGPVTFEITRWPEHGVLVQPYGPDDPRATYYPKSAKADDGFTYESRCSDKEEPHSVPLRVRPRGDKPLAAVEVTVNRLDLVHCRELWFGDGELGPALRPASILDVWDAIEPQLELDEYPLVKQAFDRIAGGHA